jgi:DNA polymerase-1
MKIIDTSQLVTDEQLAALTPDETYWVYNGLDSCITEEIRQKLTAQLDDVTRPMYEHTIRMQAPIMDMMLRGIKVDESNRKAALAKAEHEKRRLQDLLNRLTKEGLGLEKPLNPGSHTQVKWFFYEFLGLKVIKKRNTKGFYAPAADRETLEKLQQYFIAQPFVQLILALRDQRKIIGFIKTPTDPDGKLRCSFSLAGTNTGRLNSSFSDFGTGTNLQNVDNNLRYMFIADKGKILVNIDLEQADSRNVGALCWDYFYDDHGPEFAGSYLDACESGDLHTTVCRMGWTHLDWPEDRALWRPVADGLAYRTFSYRDMAKKLGHGTNYYGQPPTMSMHTKIPVAEIVSFQHNYFGAFPCIPAWHKETIHRLQTTGQLTHLFGRRRSFFKRLDDQSTINAAIAYCPQGMTGEEINHGILNLFTHPDIELLIQVHDSILFQVPIDKVNALVPIALELLKVEIELRGGRKFHVPLEAETGYNWGKRKLNKDGSLKQNEYGLTTWTGEETRSPPRKLMQKQVTLAEYL